MIKSVTYPGQYCLAGNPFIFRIVSDQLEQIDISVIINGETIEQSGYSRKCGEEYITEIDVSDIVQSFFDPDTRISGYGGIVVPLFNFLLDCTVKIADKEYPFSAIDGGISDELDGLLSDIGLDPFTYRLSNPESLFIFTTRGNLPHLELRESELFPFTFLHPGTNITFKSGSGKTINAGKMEKGTACEMDIDILLKEFVKLHHEQPSFIDVIVDNKPAFDITILKDRSSEIVHKVLFKNSLGGYEVIVITGHPSFTPEISDQVKYQVLTERSRWEDRRLRTALQPIITTQTGYKSEKELMFLFDMVCSDEIYWISADGTKRRCHVSIDGQINIPIPIITPQSLKLKVESLSGSSYYSPKTNINIPEVLLLGTEDYDIIGSENNEALQLN